MNLTLREWIIVAVALLLSLLALGLNNWYMQSRSMRIATVDIQVVLQAKQRQVGDVLARQDTAPETRRAAIESAAAYGDKVEQALQEVLSHCRCVLVSKNLVVAGAVVEDHTAAILERLKGELKAPVQ